MAESFLKIDQSIELTREEFKIMSEKNEKMDEHAEQRHREVIQLIAVIKK